MQDLTPTPQVDTPRAGRLLEPSLLAKIICALMLVGLHGCTQPRSFDSTRYAAMTSQQRADIDLAFFNEFEVVDMGSNRYGPGLGSIKKRQAEFERWANEGYLPAWIAVRLRSQRNAPEAINVLIAAADAGDVSAMCMAQLLWHKYGSNPVISDKAEFMSKLPEWTERGMAAGHGQCYVNKLTQFYSFNANDVTKSTYDYAGAMPFLLEAASQGYYRAHWYLFQRDTLFKKADLNNLSEVSRALCWGRLAAQHSNHAGFDGYLINIKSQHIFESKVSAAYESGVYKPYDTENFPVYQKIVSPKNCLEIELRKDK